MDEDRLQEILRRVHHRAEHETWMTMSVALSLCALLLIAALVLPRLGPRVAAVTAMITVLGIVIICYLVCITRVTGHGIRHAKPINVPSRQDELSEEPPGDRLLAALLILAAGAFALMLVWLVGR